MLDWGFLRSRGSAVHPSKMCSVVYKICFGPRQRFVSRRKINNCIKVEMKWVSVVSTVNVRIAVVLIASDVVSNGEGMLRMVLYLDLMDINSG